MAVVREDVVKLSFDIDGKADLDKSRDALDELKKIAGSGVGDDAFDEMIKESKRAAKGVESVADATKDIKPDGIDETVKHLKETEKEGEDAFKQLRKIAEAKFNKTVSGLKNIGTQLKNVGIQAGKLLAKGIVAGVAGVGALVATSITNYAAYEQLVGGVETLFKDSAGTVQKYADDAFKTAGMSANDYMSTVTSFSASLIQSLGGNTGAAAELANMAIIDMSDNANKMGTDISAIQDAYQGFAKQNYTMLDNLKLGYGGTQEEMKRLLDDAGKLANTKFDISSYSDIIEAIHVIQESMGIAGTTAQEASETISGSFATLKSAWSNTLTSLILGGDDFDRNVENLVESAKTFMSNLMPALVSAIGGVGSLIQELAPLIEAELPGLTQTILPSLISAATSLVSGLIVALPDIVSTLIGALPDVMSQLWESIATAFGEVPGLNKAKEFLDGLVNVITENAEAIIALIPAVIGLVFAFKAFNAVKGLSGLFGGGSGVGSGGGFFSTLANINTTTVLKGLANIAIIVAGITALAALVMLAAPYMAQLSDGKSMLEVMVVITAVGLVGSLLAWLAGIVGAIPITTVLTGLGNIALALGGFTAIAVAFGELQKVDGFTELLTSGGEVLTTICNILGQMVGSIIGGIGEGATASLPSIGDNLSAFAASLQPMFEALSGVDFEGVTDFAGAFGALIGALAAEKVTSFITGGINYAGIGTNLSTMAEGLSGFFATITTFPEGSFEKATELFDCLAGLKGLPEDGGVVGWFMGEVNFDKIATGLTLLGGAAGAFTAINNIPAEAFTKMSSLLDCLGGLKSLPNDGGVVGWFMGEVNFDKIATGLLSLTSEGMISALNTLSTIPATSFASLSALFDVLSGIKAMPSEGGIVGWFTGDSTTTLTNVASALPGVATHIAAFFTNLGGITDFTPIKSLFDTLSGIEIDSDAASKGFLGLGKSDMEKMGEGLSAFAKNAKTFFDMLSGINAASVTSFFDGLSTAGALPDTLSTLDSSVGTSLSNLVTTADTKLGELKGKFSDRLGEIITLMNSTSTAMYSSGVSIMQGVNNGMESMRSSLVATAASIAAAIQSAFDVTLDINSPSRKTYQSGVFVGEGYDLGMQSKIPDLEVTAARMGDASIPYTGHYSPDSDASTVTTRTSSTTTTISPVFNLTVSGTQDDRTTARKVKQWVNDAMNEFFESLERKTPATREA